MHLPGITTVSASVLYIQLKAAHIPGVHNSHCIRVHNPWVSGSGVKREIISHQCSAITVYIYLAETRAHATAVCEVSQNRQQGYVSLGSISNIK